jgi:DNA-binding MarR family transcriptional regulator
MKLEAEIKQTKPFKSEKQKLILNISFTHSWLNSILVERLKPFDLSPQQFNVLKILKGKHPESYSNQEIACRMIDKSSNVTRLVDKLVLKKLVNRVEHSSDRRAVSITITAKGADLLAEIDQFNLEQGSSFLNIDEAKAKIINEWLDDMRT